MPAPKVYVDAAKDVLSAIETDLLDPATGQFKQQPDYADDAALIADVEKAYTAHFGAVNPNVDAAIQGVAAVLRIFALRQ